VPALIVLSPTQSNRTEEEDTPVHRNRWLGWVILIVAAAGIFWGLFMRNPPDSPPNWGNPPIYPGAQTVVTETGKH
jgi:hypothetical protein